MLVRPLHGQSPVHRLDQIKIIDEVEANIEDDIKAIIPCIPLACKTPEKGKRNKNDNQEKKIKKIKVIK